MKTFTSQHLVLHDKCERKPYYRRGLMGDFGANALHWGQRKLLMSEIEFFTHYWDPKVVSHPLCIYAGAASGLHIAFLSELFPSFTFHLYDPSSFSISENDKIKIFTGPKDGLFTEEIAMKYKSECHRIFFISDIRTCDWKKNLHQEYEKRGLNMNEMIPDEVKKEMDQDSLNQTESEVWQDMLTQQKWVLIMNPLHALLKCRFPWPKDITNVKTTYLSGTIYLQPWCPHTSTETRLKPIKNTTTNCYELTTWDIKKYEEQLFFHNMVVRESWQFTLDDGYKYHDKYELLTNYDSFAEIFILKNYLQYKTVFEPSTRNIRSLSRRITFFLNHDVPLNQKHVITLEILRATPFKTSSRSMSTKRLHWFQEHPENWQKIAKHITKKFKLS